MGIELALKKILPNVGTDLEHFVSTFGTDLILNQKIDYDVNSNAIYIGYALPGTTTSQAKWLIKSLTYDGSNRLTTIQFANGVIKFDQIWDNRAGLSYS